MFVYKKAMGKDSYPMAFYLSIDSLIFGLGWPFVQKKGEHEKPSFNRPYKMWLEMFSPFRYCY